MGVQPLFTHDVRSVKLERTGHVSHRDAQAMAECRIHDAADEPPRHRHPGPGASDIPGRDDDFAAGSSHPEIVHCRSDADAVRVHCHDVFAAGGLEACPQRRLEPVAIGPDDAHPRVRGRQGCRLDHPARDDDLAVHGEIIELSNELARNSCPIGARAGYYD